MNSDECRNTIPEKRRRIELKSCIICSAKAPVTDLTKPKDENSWRTFLRAAHIQEYEPITKYGEDNYPCIYYHTKCRNAFTLKKTLDNIIASKEDTSSDRFAQVNRKSTREHTTNPCRVYEAVCIFCQKDSKYVKGSHSRESLTQCLELRSDEKIREAAFQKMDSRLIALVSRDVVAAEAHYHRSCYRVYTKEPKSKPVEKTDPYSDAECKAYEMLYSYIRNELVAAPRIVKMADLSGELTQYMQSLGFHNIRDSTKNHIRRKLEFEFGDTLCIIDDIDGKLLVFPNTLTREELAKENAQLIDKLKIHTDEERNMEKVLSNAALYLRREVKESAIEQSWPPLPDELNQEYLPVPNCLTLFYQLLLSGQSNQLSNRTQRLALSFAQDCIYGISSGQQKSSKHILTAWAIKSLTGNCELVRGLNRLGHCISYSQLVELDTALAMQKLVIEDVVGIAIPSNIQPGVSTTVAYDNIDRLEETLSGGGTSHRVNGIAVQAKVTTVQSENKPPGTPKEKRSINPTNIMLPPYNAGEKTEPPVIQTMDLDTGNASEEAWLKNLIWSLVRQKDIDDQKISSWTGHNIRTRDQVSVTQDSIGYLPTINAPATQMSTIFEVLNQVAQIRKLLDLPSIVCVFDQAMYEKAIDVKWRNAERFKDIVLRMGVFHTCCNLMGTIGKRFKDAGLRNLAVESGIVAEGSVDSVIDGKKYNRAIRFHKLVYEALLRLAWSGFYPWLKEHHAMYMPQLQDTHRLIEELHEVVSQETLDNVLQHPSCRCILQLFNRYLEHLRVSNGSLSRYWMSYIDMVETLLGLIRSSREGNWLMHMTFIRSMIPWSFAYDKRNYAKYLTVYYAEMTQLLKEHPDVHESLMNGGFSVQLGERNPFGRIPVDQTLEETVNKDTQTAGGTKGFSLKPGAVSKYYLTAEHRSASLRQFRKLTDTVSPACIHPDIEPTRIRKDEADVQSLVTLMEDTWTNPMDDSPSELISISTGTTATPEIEKDILNAYQIGETAYSEFKTKRMNSTKSEKFHDPLAKQNLKTFNNLKQQKIAGKSAREIVLKADHRLFGRIILIAGSINLRMIDVLKHPLGPLPWSLANSDGTHKKTNKASLARFLESKTKAADDIPQPSVCLIDGMSMVQKVHGEHKTFGEISEHLFMSALNIGTNSQRIDVIFDVYKKTSIKNVERTKRGKGVRFMNIAHGHKVHQWRKLLSCSESKTSLIQFLTTDWQRQTLRDKLCEKELFVTCEEKCIRITRDVCEEIDSLKSTQEEADTRLFLHAQHAALQFQSAVIIAEDTDVLVLGLAFSNIISCNVFMKCGTQTRTRYINLTKLAQSLGDGVCEAIIGLHAFTGCDSVSAFAGKGKVSGMKILMEDHTFQQSFATLGQEWNLTDELVCNLQEFVCRLYAARSSIKTVNDLRFQIFRTKQGEVESGQLPPCEDCLRLHVQRSNYQAGIWRRSLKALPDIPSPNGNGWIVLPDGTLAIKWMHGQPAPDAVLEFLSCKCPRVCKLPGCVCMENRLACTDSCRLSTCDNMKDEQEDDLDSSDDDEEV